MSKWCPLRDKLKPNAAYHYSSHISGDSVITQFTAFLLGENDLISIISHCPSEIVKHDTYLRRNLSL